MLHLTVDFGLRKENINQDVIESGDLVNERKNVNQWCYSINYCSERISKNFSVSVISGAVVPPRTFLMTLAASEIISSFQSHTIIIILITFCDIFLNQDSQIIVQYDFFILIHYSYYISARILLISFGFVLRYCYHRDFFLFILPHRYLFL